MRDLAGLALLPLGEFLTEVLGPLGPPFWPAISAADAQAEPAAEPPDVRAASVAEASNSTCAAKSASGSAGDGGDGGEGGGERRPLTKQERERAKQHPADGAPLPAAPNSSRSKPSIDGADGAVSLAEVNGGQPAPAAEAPFWPADYSKRAASKKHKRATASGAHHPLPKQKRPRDREADASAKQPGAARAEAKSAPQQPAALPTVAAAQPPPQVMAAAQRLQRRETQVENGKDTRVNAWRRAPQEWGEAQAEAQAADTAAGAPLTATEKAGLETEAGPETQRAG
ncbi:hypothetical protein EMIHUDRAFT_210279 [Emiliania huxleyi CCMP1516]|uniref:Uncharacterized protein n=2 Tax=Emiliania huxleyi TaxID=2903 RepID=A0A0D3IZS5_EMIH1|nr:hypothetical protein EMIHUDRAFT_210279 [Emiliania huxleyi CCMP1516]EOD16760.1 hypothetical protein EMIHUDRAFT_210279 [Emiliania huxleyi CCMP1516]|eukprot:XP_005769189.1 hypothetical protein EMIHUDRAFT_210279 [Emiliania huxleyi CCMP1516]